jgi:hypothetical protein
MGGRMFPEYLAALCRNQWPDAPGFCTIILMCGGKTANGKDDFALTKNGKLSILNVDCIRHRHISPSSAQRQRGGFFRAIYGDDVEKKL